jgi:hypothetical protein
VGALVNSLYENGYRGIIWAGYRGALPPWASPVQRRDGYDEFIVTPDCHIRFLLVTTEIHLTNHKPAFMLDLWQNQASAADRLFYFDPDITVLCEWGFFLNWVEDGVALCEDVNSPMPSSHPIRNTWRRFFEKNEIPLTKPLDAYMNGGFVGLKREHRELLAVWQQLIAVRMEEAGAGDSLLVGSRPFAFYNADQDLLNAALMACDIPLSLVGREGMDFAPGGYIMSHAIGGFKPWTKRFVRMALGGVPPSAADKSYWRNVQRPIRLYTRASLVRHRLALKVGSAIGRFLRRA